MRLGHRQWYHRLHSGMYLFSYRLFYIVGALCRHIPSLRAHTAYERMCSEANMHHPLGGSLSYPLGSLLLRKSRIVLLVQRRIHRRYLHLEHRYLREDQYTGPQSSSPAPQPAQKIRQRAKGVSDTIERHQGSRCNHCCVTGVLLTACRRIPSPNSLVQKISIRIR